MNLYHLQDILQKKLQVKKLLLILDDIWHTEILSDYVNTERRITFLEPLRRANSHVMILVTIRMMLINKFLKFYCYMPTLQKALNTKWAVTHHLELKRS